MNCMDDLSSSDDLTWKWRTFCDLSAVIGSAKAQAIVERFAADVAKRFAEPCDRDITRRDAHVIASSAGLLGFTGLSTRAAALESACRNGAYEPCLTALVAERDSALRLIDLRLRITQTG